MNTTDQAIEKVGPAPYSKGYLESSEETLSMVPFKEHPKGLVAFEERYIYENKACIKPKSLCREYLASLITLNWMMPHCMPIECLVENYLVVPGILMFLKCQ